MYMIDFSDLMFFVKSIKQPSDNFSILHHVSFGCSNTRSSSKLSHIYSPNNTINSSYFVKHPRLWNSLPSIDFNQSFNTTKTFIYNYLRSHFETNFNQYDPCSFHFYCSCFNYYSVNHSTNFNIIQ